MVQALLSLPVVETKNWLPVKSAPELPPFAEHVKAPVSAAFVPSPFRTFTVTCPEVLGQAASVAVMVPGEHEVTDAAAPLTVTVRAAVAPVVVVQFVPTKPDPLIWMVIPLPVVLVT